MNDIMKRALTSAKVPFHFEASGLHRADGKHPDDITVVPWRSGKLLIWDVTFQDTFAPSNSAHATREARAVATLAQERKVAKYVHLTQCISSPQSQRRQ